MRIKINKIIIGLIIFSIIGNLFFIIIEPKASDLETWIMTAKALLKRSDFYEAAFIPGHYFAYPPLFAEAIIFPIALLFNPYNEFQFLLALRVVFLLCNVLIGIVLWKLFRIKKPTMLALWVLNPLVWSISQYQFDSIVALFLMLSVYFFIRKKVIISGFFAGISIALKLYPIIIVPFLLLKLRNNLERIKYFLSLTIVPSISCLPFLSSKFFLKSVFEFNISRGLIHLFLLTYFLILILAMILKRSLIESMASILMLFCVFYVGIYSIQYLVIVLPFLLLNLNFHQTKINFLIYNSIWINSFLLRHTPFLYRRISFNIPQSFTSYLIY
ncbi:MAG: glycosyltransferase family 87 protein [Candidatus Bathyarchaeia archaeon]